MSDRREFVDYAIRYDAPPFGYDYDSGYSDIEDARTALGRARGMAAIYPEDGYETATLVRRQVVFEYGDWEVVA